jgi:hypothetical protein
MTLAKLSKKTNAHSFLVRLIAFNYRVELVVIANHDKLLALQYWNKRQGLHHQTCLIHKAEVEFHGLEESALRIENVGDKNISFLYKVTHRLDRAKFVERVAMRLDQRVLKINSTRMLYQPNFILFVLLEF